MEPLLAGRSIKLLNGSVAKSNSKLRELRLHIPAVLATHIIKRMTHTAERTGLGGIH